MATDAGISAVLAFLHELFPTRDIGPATLDAWALMFNGWPDDDVRECAVAAAKEPGRVFFPTPGEISAHRRLPPIDADALLNRIAGLGRHNPREGWQYPRAETIREQLGEAVADAYFAAGGALCFASESSDGSSVTRDIARRAFAAELSTLQRRNPDRVLIQPPPAPLLLEAEHRDRTPFAELPAEEQQRLFPPEPFTPKTAMKISRDYVVAQQAFGSNLAIQPEHEARFRECMERVERRYTENGFPMPLPAIAKAAHREFATANGFPVFGVWLTQRGTSKVPHEQPLKDLVAEVTP